MDDNTYYTCKCIYLEDGYILCDICQKMVDKSQTEQLKKKACHYC